MQPRAEYLAVNAGEDWVSMFKAVRWQVHPRAR
jgi:hypothetical protein